MAREGRREVNVLVDGIIREVVSVSAKQERFNKNGLAVCYR